MDLLKYVLQENTISVFNKKKFSVVFVSVNYNNPKTEN